METHSWPVPRTHSNASRTASVRTSSEGSVAGSTVSSSPIRPRRSVAGTLLVVGCILVAGQQWVMHSVDSNVWRHRVMSVTEPSPSSFLLDSNQTKYESLSTERVIWRNVSTRSFEGHHDTEAPPTAWCLLHANNTNPYFTHFPHAMESFSQCWSYVCRVRETVHPDIQCGIYLHSSLKWHWLAQWAHDLLAYANCTVINADAPPAQMDYAWEVNHDLEDRFRTPWFERPQDAQLLVQQVLRHSPVPIPQSTKTRRIGLVVRPRLEGRRNRAWLNLDDIIEALYATLDDIHINVADMNNLTMLEQATFFASHDVLVAVHGAAVTNALFVRTHLHDPTQSAALVEIFPDAWNFRMFQTLMRTAGNPRHYSLSRNTSGTPRGEENDARQVDMRPNVTLLVEQVRLALQDPFATTHPWPQWHDESQVQQM